MVVGVRWVVVGLSFGLDDKGIARRHLLVADSRDTVTRESMTEWGWGEAKCAINRWVVR